MVSSDFGNTENKIYLKNPGDLSKTSFSVSAVNLADLKEYPVNIKIRSWIKDKYFLNVKAQLPPGNFFVYTYKDTTYFFENGKLYISTKTHPSKQYICDFKLEDKMYNQMSVLGGHYPVRTGHKLFVSKDLKKLTLVFDGSRGIKESMVWLKSVEGYILLFSEYTPGDKYVRHHIRSYNMATSELKIKKVFYARYEGKLPVVSGLLF